MDFIDIHHHDSENGTEPSKYEEIRDAMIERINQKKSYINKRRLASKQLSFEIMEGNSIMEE
jgi:hypothetical protein